MNNPTSPLAPNTRSWRWRNKYIDLLLTKPQLILACAEGTMTESERAHLQSRLSAFTHHIVELGSGSGGHLIELARRNPDILCIGLERRYKRVFRTAEKAEQQQINNLLMIHHDARQVATIFPTDSLDTVYVNFPEPWSKSRWLKHRLITPQLVGKISALLKPGGRFSCKTDQPGYADWVIECIASQPDLVVEINCQDLYASEHATTNIPTEFEQLFCSQGLPIHYVTARKKD